VSLVSLVTGANRGIGREVARQLAALGHHVVVGARDGAKGMAVADEIRAAGARATPLELDVTSAESVGAAVGVIATNPGSLDVLVNNAAINYDTWQGAVDADLDEVGETLDTNLFGTWRITRALLPLLRQSPHARIVNVSSGAGALSDMGGRAPGYRVSKVGVNALTRMWAAELPGILVNSVCPGWVATDMGGAGGRPIEEGAAGIVWAATLPEGGPTGGFFRDGQRIDW
jgi:NAD(P)-dependent dehydrogenase (short-subunit alcohol dehydrogenase family)